MTQEAKTEANNKEQEFKNEIFANSPSLYKEMFVEDEVLDESDIEYITPENDAEFKKMLKELGSYGIID